jgi:hypothetical protein
VVTGWVGRVPPVPWVWARSLPVLRRFDRFSHWGMLRAHRDFGRRLCSLALLSGGRHCISGWIVSDRDKGGVWRGRHCGLDNTASMDHVISAGTQALLFYGRLCPLCLRDGWAGWVSHSTAFGGCPLSKRRLRLFPFRTAPVAGCVVTSAAAALKLLLRGGALPWEVSLPTSNTPGCVSAVALCMAEALTALTLQGFLGGGERFHRDPQTAELGQGTHLRHLRLTVEWPCCTSYCADSYVRLSRPLCGILLRSHFVSRNKIFGCAYFSMHFRIKFLLFILDVMYTSFRRLFRASITGRSVWSRC